MKRSNQIWQVLCPLRCDSAKVAPGVSHGTRVCECLWVDPPQNCKLSWLRWRLQRILTGQVLWFACTELLDTSVVFRARKWYTCLLARVSFIHSDLVTIAIVMTGSHFLSQIAQSLSLPGRTCELCNASIIDHTILWNAEDGGCPSIATYCDHSSSLTCSCRGKAFRIAVIM